MVSVSIDDVRNAASLSGLKLSDKELETYREQFAEILGYIDRLSKVETKDVEPTYQVTGLSNVMRKDEIINYEVSSEELLKNAPDVNGHQIRVKRVL